MRFKKFTLDEALFDETPSRVEHVSALSSYDDDFVATELPTEDMQGPKSGSDAGVTDLLITAINDEWEAIRSYNSLIETLKYEATNNPSYKSFIAILNEINSEENKHVGQLQEILQRLSPNTKYIDKGRQEGRSQFNFTDGKLQVQTWGPAQSPVNSDSSCENDMCTITDIDDDM